MPSHLSTIGFKVESDDELLDLANTIGPQATPYEVEGGTYYRWRGDSGEELWLILDNEGDLVGTNPHFSGESSIAVGVQARIERVPDFPLEGAYYVWASPPEDDLEAGEYPFVFDCPDATTYADIDLPGRCTAQVAAFAHEIEFFASEAAFDASQTEAETRFASKSFFPIGLFSEDGEAASPPDATALFTGTVVKAASKTNPMSGNRFHWALVETLGGQFDVVIDPELLAATPEPGGILSGVFWLSGRLVEYPKRKDKFRVIQGGAGK
ncbi:MAG: hypothetical protein R3B13_20335 [Polyangiaceae bacterium]